MITNLGLQGVEDGGRIVQLGYRTHQSDRIDVQARIDDSTISIESRLGYEPLGFPETCRKRLSLSAGRQVSCST